MVEWFSALGTSPRATGRANAHTLLINEGYDLTEAALVLTVVCREIEHDQPRLAQRYLRTFLGPGNETLMFRTLATLITEVTDG